MWTGTSRRITWVPFVPFFLGTTALGQGAPPIVEVSGRVTDTSAEPIDHAVVKAVGTDVSAVLTDATGKYKFYLVGQEKRFSLCVSKEDYPLDKQARATELVLEQAEVLCRDWADNGQ